MTSAFKPYYAVIFTSKINNHSEGYVEMADYMIQLSKTQKGFLGVDSVHENIGITVSYWENLDAIKLWKANFEHQKAQQKGKKQWYNWYNVKICKVEREYAFKSS